MHLTCLADITFTWRLKSSSHIDSTIGTCHLRRPNRQRIMHPTLSISCNIVYMWSSLLEQQEFSGHLQPVILLLFLQDHKRFAALRSTRATTKKLQSVKGATYKKNNTSKRLMFPNLTRQSVFLVLVSHGSLNVPIFHITQPLDSTRYMVYNGYYKVMSNIPKMGHLPTPVSDPYQETTSATPPAATAPFVWCRGWCRCTCINSTALSKERCDMISHRLGESSTCQWSRTFDQSLKVAAVLEQRPSQAIKEGKWKKHMDFSTR